VLRHRFLAALVPVALIVSACGDDDGAGVRNIGDECGGSASASAASGSAASGSEASGSETTETTEASGSETTETTEASGSASGSASGGSASCPSGSGSASGSGSGISGEVEGSSTDNPLVEDAVTAYTAYVGEQVDATIAATTTFTDAVREGDLAAAKAAYAPSRQGWERIEPIAGLVEEIDGKVDARVDDFENEQDPEFTGWHRIEYILFSQNTTEGAAPFADQLDADLQTLKTELAGIEIPPAALAVGSSELIEEVSTGKITGEEDRYSGTDLWDFAANVEGSEEAFTLLTPAIEQEDPELVAEIQAEFAELETQLGKYADGAGGYQPYSALTEADKAAMQTTLAALSENLATVAGVLGLE
jgi:iron uptake system component EfeO